MDKKLLFIVNPRAGRTKSFAPLFDAVACFSKAGYLVKVFLTEGRGDATRAAAELGGAYDLVVCAGGDGTFNEALTGIYGYANAAVGCLPFGSGNDFLRTFGTKEEFLDLDAQLAGGPVSIDLMQTSLGLSATIWMRRLPTASRSSGASHCAAARWPMCFPLWNSCADTSAAGWSTPSMVKRWMWTA